MTKMGHRGKLDILRDPDTCVADFKRWAGTEVAPKFKKSITRGFAAVGQPNVAVCLLPGTEITFDENVECEPSFGIGDPPPSKWSDLRYVFDIKEDCNGKEAIQT
jgi:hypothetical protein